MNYSPPTATYMTCILSRHAQEDIALADALVKALLTNPEYCDCSPEFLREVLAHTLALIRAGVVSINQHPDPL